MKRIQKLAAAVVVLSCTFCMGQQHQLVLGGNMKALKCAMPDVKYRFAGSNAPGQMFYPGEEVAVRLVLSREKDQGEVKDFAVEMQEITWRDPKLFIDDPAGVTDFGKAVGIGLEGKPVSQPLAVTFDDRPQKEVEVKLALPGKCGCYALILTRGEMRQFLGTVARVPRPVEGGNLENTPIFGEGAMFDNPAQFAGRAQQYQRMGVHGFRAETGWMQQKDGKVDWSRLDKMFEASQAAHVQIMLTLGSHAEWTRYFGEPTPAAGWTPKTGGYSATGDWVCEPKYYPQWGEWITAICGRYWKDGAGALWGVELYNEPWEGGGISGWARDCLQYREMMKVMANSARKVDAKIKLLAASSIMNTEDKFYSDGSSAMDKYIDVFTDHYVPPPTCYGPMVAKKHGKESVETETWFVNSEYLLPQMVQFLAAGQLRLSPWHPRVLFDSVPGTQDNYFIPTPLVTASAAFNHFVTGKRFEKIVFKDHLPWVFQFGKDDDDDALLVVFGQLMTIGDNNPKERLWAQVEGSDGGTMTIDNADGLLKFYDLAGNEMHGDEKSVTVPMSIFPTYIKCTKGPAAAAERIAGAKIEDKRAVEIIPHDLLAGPGAENVTITVDVHNCLNRAIEGTLTISPPTEMKLKETSVKLAMKAGETVTSSFAVDGPLAAGQTAFPVSLKFSSAAGDAEYKEVINVTAIAHKTITVDGDLADWNEVPGIVCVAGAEKADVSEQLRRPWLELKDKQPDGSFAEVKFAWDENNLYVSARVNHPKPQMDKMRIEGRDENMFFHSKASDEIEPYKTFLTKHPGKTFADVPYVYRIRADGPQFSAFRGDRVQLAIDCVGGFHDLEPANNVPLGFHALPDTDYEYSLYLCDDGKSELWRLLAPGVPRMHDAPRQPRGEKTTGAVKAARHVVKQDGNVRIYEAAIPKEELAEMKLSAGTKFGMTFRIGFANGPTIDFGTDKAATKINGLTLHPYWERSPNCGVQWVLAK